MQLTRFVVAGLLAVAIAVGGAAVAFAADGPSNRGWTAPVGADAEFDDGQSG